MVCDSGRVVESWRAGRGWYTADSGRPCGCSAALSLRVAQLAGTGRARRASGDGACGAAHVQVRSGMVSQSSESTVGLLGEIHSDQERERESVSEL
eukprot:6485047-Prymnesium_polylepis.2